MAPVQLSALRASVQLVQLQAAFRDERELSKFLEDILARLHSRDLAQWVVEHGSIRSYRAFLKTFREFSEGLQEAAST